MIILEAEPVASRSATGCVCQQAETCLNAASMQTTPLNASDAGTMHLRLFNLWLLFIL